MIEFKVASKTIGPDAPCLIMVDAGVNHNNDRERALDLIRTAAEGGADVVKFQTYTAETIATRTAPRYWDPRLDSDGGGTQFDTFSRLDRLDRQTYVEMAELCKEIGIAFSSTPFDLESASFLTDIGVDLFKISSSDLTFHHLLKIVAEYGKPVILSTGCATIGEIEEAVKIIRDTGNEQIGLQHCILSYPCAVADANLAKMLKIQEVFPELPVGFSDHTQGLAAPLAAVALGARSIEKHYTIDRGLPDSPDHLFSLDPDALKEMVERVREVESSIGSFVNGPYEIESKAYLYARKSIVSKKEIPLGTLITPEMLICKRPGTGIYPKYFDNITGRTARVNIPADTVITWDMV